MEKQIITFSANEQCLQKTGGIDCYASNIVSYIEARFELGDNWSGYDSVRAVWFTDFVSGISTVLDSDGVCIVPHEVLTRKSAVKVNLVGSIADGDVLTDRLTTCPVTAVAVKCNAKVTGANSTPITPSEYEQFVQNVKADADRAEAGATAAEQSAVNANASADEAEASAQNASESASASAISASDSARSATASAESAQNASESAQNAENAKDDAESARDKILSMRATASTLPAGSDATASYSDGLLSLGIPKGDKGDTGAKGDKGDTGATPNLTIGTVETLAPTEDATATITGTAENPVLNLGIPKGEQGDVNLSQLEALLPTETASGEIVTITDGQSVVPAKSLKVALEPIQDLHGYDKPWIGGAGKNKLPSIGATFTDSGVTWMLNDDGSVKLSGTASANSVYDFGRNVVELEAGKYFANETASGYSVTVFSIVGGTASVIKSGGGQFTLTEKTSVFMRVLVASGTTPNTMIYPQIEKSASFTGYEPFSNICPISGRTEVVTQRTGKNLLNPSLYKFQTATRNGLTYTVNNDGTISVTGTVTATGGPSLTDYFYLPAGTYSFIEETSQNVYCAYRRIPSGQSSSSALASPFTTDGNDRIYINLYSKVSSGNIDLTIHPQIEAGSTSSEFEPYEAETYTTSLGRTVYGGTLDVVSGVLTVDRAMVDLGTLTWNIYNGKFTSVLNPAPLRKTLGAINMICSMYATGVYGSSASQGDGMIWLSASTSINTLYVEDSRYSDATDFKTAMSGVQLCYELATPQTYQLTPQQVELLQGENNVWSDGDVTIVYNADIQKWVEKQLS